MGEIITRKCAHCKNMIEVDIDDIKGIAARNGLHYHKSCLLELAATRLENKKGKWQIWQDITDNIEKYELEAHRLLKNYVARDELNIYILETYNVTTIPERFFQVVADLALGKYRQKRCNPVQVYELLGAWRWGQHNLDKIYRNNKMKGVGPANDTERIMYDLAIIVGKVHLYLEYTKKQAIAQTETQNNSHIVDDIDMTKIGQNKQETKRDISSISDFLFVE